MKTPNKEDDPRQAVIKSFVMQSLDRIQEMRLTVDNIAKNLDNFQAEAPNLGTTASQQIKATEALIQLAKVESALRGAYLFIDGMQRP